MIRLANKWDIPQLKELFTCYYQEQFPQYTDIPMANVEKLLTMVIAGAGVAVVDEQLGEIKGAIIAVVCPNVWDPSKMVLTEILFYVRPNWRNGLSGGRLIRRYTEIGQEWRDAGKVVHFTISHTSKLPIDYSRWDYKNGESVWYQ